MWDNNEESIVMAKNLTEELYDLWKNKAFCKEILNAIDGDLDIARNILFELKKYEKLVPADIYDYLDNNLLGGYKKSFSLLSQLKRKCIERGDAQSWKELFEAFKSETCYEVIEWELTGAEKKNIESSKVGDTLRINTDPRPLLIQGKEDNEYVVPIFTSMYEIDRRYHGEDYAISETSFEQMMAIFNALYNNNSRTIIVLDVDSNKHLEITPEIIDKYWNVY